MIQMQITDCQISKVAHFSLMVQFFSILGLLFPTSQPSVPQGPSLVSGEVPPVWTPRRILKLSTKCLCPFSQVLALSQNFNRFVRQSFPLQEALLPPLL